MAASAQDAFPCRPLHFFVPYRPGGAVDILARTLGDELGRRWGQAVVVENRPGGGGIIAEQALAQSPPASASAFEVDGMKRLISASIANRRTRARRSARR